MATFHVDIDGNVSTKKKKKKENKKPTYHVDIKGNVTENKPEVKPTTKKTTTKETKFSDFRSSRAELEKNRLVKQYSSRNPLDYMQKADAERELLSMGYSEEQIKKLRKEYRASKDDGLDIVRSGAFGRDDIGAVEKGVLGVGGTGLHVARNLVEGAILNPLEGGADAIRYGTAYILEGLGAKETAQTFRDVAKENDMDKLLSFSDDYFERNSTLGQDTEGFVQALGQVFGLKGLGSILSKAGLGAKGVSTAITGTNFITSAGMGTTEAYQSGATDQEALKYGLMQGGIDAGTELLSGGLGKGTKALGLSHGVLDADDLIAKSLTKNMKNPTAKNTMQGLIKGFGEGGEEWLAGYLSAHAQKGTFRSEDSFEDIKKDQQLGKQFLTGMLVSDIAQAGSIRKASKQGVDYVTGYTQNEQSVVDRIANDEIQKAEKDGKKLSTKEKNKIREDVETMLQRGEIDIDTIESTLGGETYKAHESLVKESEEFETLRNKKQGDMTDIEQDRLKELKAKNTEKSYSDLISESKAKLSEEVNLATQNDMFLRESYAERGRRGQQFTVSEEQMKKYSVKEREIVQKAIDYGEMNNTRKAHEFVDLVAKLSADKGVSFDFTNNEKLKNSGFAIEGKTINGFKQGNNITINLQSKNALNTVVGHEITHVLEGTELYNQLQGAVIEYAKQKGVYDSMYKDIVHLYRNQFQDNDLQKRKQLYDSEITADLVGQYIFSDVDFVRNLSMKNRNVFQKVYDEIKYFLKTVKSGSDAEKQLLKAKKIFEDVYRDTNKKSVVNGDEDVRFSIREEAPPKNTKKAYKLMRYVDGKYYPLFIGNNEAIEQGVWYNADSPNLDMLKDLDVGTHMVNMESGEAITFEQYVEENVGRKKDGTLPRTKPNADDIRWANENGYRFMLIEDKSGTKSANRFAQTYGDSRAYYNWGINGSSKSKTGEGSASLYALRPGWHFGDLPSMRQIGYTSDSGAKDMRLDNQVWVEVEMSADVDYNEEARSNYNGDIPTHIPKDGYYEFATNPTQKKTKSGDSANDKSKGNWYVSGAFKIVRPLGDVEARQIVDKYNQDNGTNVPYDYERANGRVFNADKMELEDGVQYSVSDNNIKHEVTDFHNDEMFAILKYEQDGKVVGTLEYSEYDGEPSVKMVQVDEKYRRKGIGTKLLQELQRKYPNTEINMGMTTEDGSKLLDNITYTVENKEVVDKFARAKEIESKLAEYDETLEKFYNDEIELQEGYAEDYNDLYDELVDLKKELRGKKRTKTFIKTDSDVQYSLSDNQGNKINPLVQKRFANSKAVDENGDLKVLYHGTASGEFSIFDKAKGSVEGDFGSGFYFTDNESDVEANYEGGGPDFENKVSRRAEQIEAEEEIDYAEAERRAREELFKGEHKFEVYLNIENPAIVGETRLLDMESYMENYDESDFEDYDEYMAEIEQLISDDIDSIIWDIDSKLDVYGDTSQIASVLWESINEGGLDIADLKHKINELYLEDNEGNLIGNEVTRQIIESLGYDGIIDNTVSSKFNMNLSEDTTHYIVFKPNQIKAITNENPTDNPDINLSLSGNKPLAPKPNGIYAEDIALEKPIAPIQSVDTNNMIEEIAPTDHLGEVTEKVEKTITAPISKREVHGMDTLPLPQEHEVKGVRMSSDEKARKGEIRRWADTSTESEVVNGEVLLSDLDQEKIYYEPIPNKKTLAVANADLDRMGYDKALQVFKSKIDTKTVSLSDIALGERLVQESLKRGDKTTTAELIQDIAILGTELGQKVQALSIIQRMTPEGQLKMLRKVVNRGKAKGDKAFKNVEFTQEMEGKILDAYNQDGTYNQDKLNEAVESVKKDIADQMEVTNMDKVNAWRMLSMLGNPKTHIRNIVSNVTMQATNEMKNAVARTIETIAPIKNRTKTWKTASEDVKKFAEESTKETEAILMGEHSYSEVADIKSKRDVFKNKILQKVYDFNSDMLTKEDAFFKIPVYRKSLQEFLTANGINTKEDIQNNKKLVEKGKQYALEQSQIATFQQYSWLANKINEIERKNVATQIGVGAVLPFKKTPINIAKTGLAYSPLGFAKSLSYDLVQMKNGNMEASQVIDNLSKGVTGSALTYIGYMLAMSGLLNGGGEDDKEGKYDYQLGKQSYSLNYGGNTYSLSWLTPVAMPLFVGANAYEMAKEGKELTFDTTMDALAQTLDPMSEMSFLSSLDSVLTSYESGAGKFMGIFETAGQNYVTQFAPTLISQVAQVTDDKKRSTQVSADSDARIIEQTINKLKYKIPLLRQTLEPTIDIWGNEVKQSENMVGRAVETFIAPYSRKESIATEIDEEIKGLYSQTGDTGIIPNVPSNKVQYGGETYRMSAREFTDYKKTYGQTANEMLEDLFRTETYQNADSTTRAELVSKVYDYARDVSKKAYLEKEGVEYTNTTQDGVPVYKENKIKGAIDNDMMLEEFDLYTKSKGKYHISKLVGGYDSYKQYHKELDNLVSDKNAKGETIKNSLKNKKFAYINNLNVDYNTKMILWKQQYPADDRYNVEIIEYLNERQDITYEDMVDILEELDFKVSADGTVRW